MWELISNVEISGLIQPKLLSNNPIPVFLTSVGRNHEFFNESGESHKSYPHVEVRLVEGVFNGLRVINSYYITANGAANSSGYSQSINLASAEKCSTITNIEGIQNLIENLSEEITNAISACLSIDKTFSTAEQKLESLKKLLPLCETRGGYEQACATAGVNALTDTEIENSYCIQWGNFTYPAYDPEYIIVMRLAAARFTSIKAASVPERLNNSVQIKPQGQVWEPCEYCGCEPALLPLHLCEKCWPA